jgi:phosphoribosylglycinamide formyltransferase 1
MSLRFKSTSLVNLAVDLDERYASDADARGRIERAGYGVSVRSSASDAVLAWIDEVFGGAWSSEVAVAQSVVATVDGAPAGFAAFDPVGLRFAWLREMARAPGVGIFGPFGVAPTLRGTLAGAPQGDTLGSSLLHIALCGLRARGYRRALIGATSDALVPYYQRYTDARVAERYDPQSFTPKPVRTVVLASGSGSNFQAVLDRVADGLPLDLVALVSNKPNAFAIARAEHADIPAIVVPWERDAQSRAGYDRQLLEAVSRCEPELVLLLGWMHLLAPEFVDTFPQMFNVHPAFLPLDPARDVVGMPDGVTIPAFRGARAVRDALAVDSPWVGASVHQVTTETDRGRVLARKPLRVVTGEDEETVLARLHPIEHQLVAVAIRRWLFERE